MAKKNAAKELEAVVASLTEERQEHLDAIAEIDSVFAQFGIKPPGRKRRARRGSKKVGRPRKAKKRVGKRVAKRGKKTRRGRKKKKKVLKRSKTRTRRKFRVSGPEAVLNFVRRAGKNGASGAEIEKHWNSRGRKAGVYNTIGKLVKEKKLKKQAVKGEKGSRYTVV